MRLHPSNCPFPRQTFEELLSSVSEYAKNDKKTALGLSGSQTDRPNSNLKVNQDLRYSAASTNGSTLADKHGTELLSQRSLKVAKLLYNDKGRMFSAGSDGRQSHSTKVPWDGTVYNEVSLKASNAGANQSTTAFAMDDCEQSIARLQRELEESGKKQRPILKSFVQDNSRDGDGFKEKNIQSSQSLRVPSDVKGRIAIPSLYPSDGQQFKEATDSNDIAAIVMKLSMPRTFLEFMKVVHGEFIAVCGCERAQIHFVNPVLNLSKLDNDAFLRPFDLWSANFPDSIVPCHHSQQSARQYITIRINEEAGKGSVLYVPIPIPASETSPWKLFGVAELCRSTENFWTQADESKVKFLVDLISSMCVQRYKACRTEFERRQAVLIKEATQTLHSQDEPDMLCYKAASFACRLTNAQAARVLLASDDGKSAAVYSLLEQRRRGIRRQPEEGGRPTCTTVIEGELPAVYTTVIRTGKSLAVADTRRDPRFAASVRPAPELPFSTHAARPASGTAAETLPGRAHAKPSRPNTAPEAATSLSRAEAATRPSRGPLQPQPPQMHPAGSGAESGPRPGRFRVSNPQPAGGGRLSRQAGLVYGDEREPEAAAVDAEEEDEGAGEDDSDTRRAESTEPPTAREVADNAILMAVVDDSVADSEFEGGDEASRRPVRGVLEVVNKRTGAFDEADRAVLAALCGTLYRCLIQAGRRQVLQETLACDCRLLASSSVQQVVASALDKARLSTRSELAAFYGPVEGKRVLQSEGVTPRHEVRCPGGTVGTDTGARCVV
jgi:hypothetical protein